MRTNFPGLDLFGMAQGFAHSLFDSAGAHPVNDPHGRQPGQESLVKIIFQFIKGIIHPLTAQVKLDARRSMKNLLRGVFAA